MASSNSGSVSQPVVFSRHGSVFANHLVQSMLITAKEPKESKEEGRSTEVRDDGLIKIEQDDEGIEVSESMDALNNQILSECQLKFGDEWTECEFSFPKQFIDAPLRKDTYSSMEARFVSTTSKSHSDIVALVKEKAIRYMSSRPGRDESGGDTRCHSLCKQSIQGILEPDRLLILNDMLNYRNHQLEIAGRYAVKLGSSKDGIPDQFDQVEWHSSLNKDRISGSSVRKHRAADLKKRFADMLDRIDDLRLFDTPLWTQGFDYSKPPEYLAAKLAESSMPLSLIEEKLQDLLQNKLRGLVELAQSPLGQENSPATRSPHFVGSLL